MLRSSIKFKVLKCLLDKFVGSIRQFKNHFHFLAKGSLHYFTDTLLENAFHSLHGADCVGQFCLVCDDRTEAPKRLNVKEFRNGLDVRGFGDAGKLVSVERCVGRARNALTYLLPW